MAYIKLRNMWHAYKLDNYLLTENNANPAGYIFGSDEGFISDTELPNTVPLKLFWSELSRDHFSTATAIGEQSAIAAGYEFIEIQGYIWSSQLSNLLIPLVSWFNIERPDNFTCASKKGNSDAAKTSYKKLRVEGYVLSTLP